MHALRSALHFALTHRAGFFYGVRVNFVNSGGEIRKHGDALPHWQQGAALQFVTFRLGDALPASLIDTWRSERDVWVKENPKPWTQDIQAEYHRRFSRRIEHWLDQGMGSCVFGAPDAREVLKAVLMRFEGERVLHHAWVIMPNHIHMLFSPLVPMEKLIQAWKAHTARALGKGPIWQRDYRDTLIRDWDHYQNVVRYIRRNPLKAKLPERHFTLWESERASRI
jgi:REP element-mobilizing transposase RayT